MMVFCFKRITAPHLAILIVIVVFTCLAEALEADEPNPSGDSQIRRRKRFWRSCPDLKMICPTKEQYFVVRTSWHGRFFGKCKIQGSVLDMALKECDIAPMDQCMDKWKNKINNCSVPVIILKQILDHVFHPACTLHDLCYLTPNADRGDCDKWFYHNLKQICLMKKISYLACRGTAYIMHKAVRGFGNPFFDDGQDWGDKNCANLEIPGTTKSPIIEGSGSGMQSGSGIVPVIPETIQ